MWNCCGDQGSNQFSLSLWFEGKQEDCLGRLQEQLDKHLSGCVNSGPPLVMVRVTFSRCLLALRFCAGTGLPDTLSPSLWKEGRHHGLRRLPLAYGTLRYAWVRWVSLHHWTLGSLLSSPPYKPIRRLPVTSAPWDLQHGSPGLCPGSTSKRVVSSAVFTGIVLFTIQVQPQICSRASLSLLL